MVYAEEPRGGARALLCEVRTARARCVLVRYGKKNVQDFRTRPSGAARVTDGSFASARRLVTACFWRSGDRRFSRPVANLSGHFKVPQTLGSLKGSNLFHSFARFINSIDSNESATFKTTTSSIQNVISRVTGGEASRIHGVEARALTIDAQPQPGTGFLATGIFSRAEARAVRQADAGRIKVTVADELSILNGGAISSSSNNAAAGEVEVQARSVKIAGFITDEGGFLQRSRIASVPGNFLSDTPQEKSR